MAARGIVSAAALVLALGASAAFADGCPVAPDHGEALAALQDRLQRAPDPATAQALNGQMWQLWLDAPDGPSQAMLNEGMRARASFDYLRALDRLGALVSYCPFYAEGYNQRAFVHYLRQDYAGALPDLDRALDLNPGHIGALSGKALTLLAMGREAEGQRVLRAAVALNPWLGERALLTDEGDPL